MLFIIFIIIFPLLFIPDVGISIQTRYGTLTPADFVLPLIYLILSPAFLKKSKIIFPRYLSSNYFAFLAWAILGVFLIYVKFPYMQYPDDQVKFCLLKIGKFFEYSFICFLLFKTLDNKKKIGLFINSIAVGCVILSVSILYSVATGWDPKDEVISKGSLVYYGANSTSVVLAQLICFWTTVFIQKRLSLSLNVIYIFLGLMIAAIIATQGRGGWVATAGGICYLLIRQRAKLRGANSRKAGFAALFIGVFMILFSSFAGIKTTILSTIMPKVYSIRSTSDFGKKYGIEDGNRVDIFMYSAAKIVNNPILGAGFFNRTPETQLLSSGSHNFFLQMILETGLIGCYFVIRILYNLWTRSKKNGYINISWGNYYDAFKAVIIVVVVGCMSGEYLYGGLTLLIFSSIAAISLAENADILSKYQYGANFVNESD